MRVLHIITICCIILLGNTCVYAFTEYERKANDISQYVEQNNPVTHMPLTHKDTLQAYTDGKRIYIGDGLLEKLTYIQGVFVLLHEYGHYKLGHTVKLARDVEQQCVLQSDNYVICYNLFLYAYKDTSYNNEYQADRIAYRSLRALNYTQDDVCSVFTQLSKALKIDMNRSSNTHPTLQSRMDKCIEFFSENP